ncbi:phage integrase family protein [Methanococcus maripaludis C5]|uniref:Phage integrase family protein n=1 Tax=Methanococcus maripaludis (strain C5 / ATCC BAA-1333) TaxID=402880 RepID=A4FZG1_METM5|nr:tyrosine-type recombinase/integrase [Methanococcus maripaludis]ABO35595.1 phage integrase family protein [Methanococcus maripaludis C5]
MDESSEKLVEKFLKFHSGHSQNTVKYYKSGLKAFMRYFDENKTWENITIEDAINFYNGYNKTGDGRAVNKNTKIKRLNDVNRFYEWAVEHQFLFKNPVKTFVKTLKFEKKERINLSEKQVATVLAKVMNYDYYVYTLFLLKTGVRISEFQNILFNDVDLEDRSIYIRDGKGGKDRYVFIDNELLNHLKKYIAYRENLNLKTNCFFVTEQGKKVTNYAIDKFREYLKEVTKDKIPFDVTPHVFRHTFGTLACEDEMNLIVLSKIMGHSNLNTTSGYVHSNKESRKKEYLRVMNNKK